MASGYSSFPARLKQLRIAGGWSQQALSEALYSTRDCVLHWEHGYSHPRAAHLPRLAAVLGCSLDYLLTGEESPHSGIHRAIRANP